MTPSAFIRRGFFLSSKEQSMNIICTWEALDDWVRACPDPDIAALLQTRRDQLIDLGALEEVGVFVIMEAGDRLSALEEAMGVPLVTDCAPNWEWVVRHGSIFEAPVVLSDDGFGHILVVPDTEGIDPELRALLREHA
jgi:hypothetical protein